MISVAMATYNGEKYIKKQLISVLKNISADDEIVISDDGSNDKTLDIIYSFRDQRIKVFKGEGKGINKNFANAISKCNGYYIFLCDQDDYWYSNKISIVMDVFKRENCVLVVHDARIVNEKDEVIFDSFFDHRIMKKGIFNNWLKNCYHGCLMAFKKSIIDQILPIPSKGGFHDQWIGIIAEMTGEVYFLNKKLMDYYRRNDNASCFKGISTGKRIYNRFWLLLNLINFRFLRK